MATAKDISDCKEKEEILQLREAHFNTLFENVPDAMVIIDAVTGKFVDANAKAVRLFGLEREELIGIGPIDISPPVQPNGRSSEEVIHEKLQDLLSEYPKPFEWVHKHVSGREILCEIRHTKLPIQEQQLYCAMAIDITERRRAENEITQYKHIIESTNNPVGLVDRGYIYRYVNKPYCQALNKPIHDIIGHSVLELFGRDFFETVMEPHYKRCFTGEIVDYQTWFDFPGWGRRYMDVRYYPFREGDGQIVAAVVNVHDITEIKHIEMKLKESEEQFRAFMDNNPAVIYIKDKNDVHLYGNNLAAVTVGIKPENFIGSTTRDIFPPELADRLIDLDQRILNENIDQVTEVFKVTDEENVRWFKDIKFPINIRPGEKLLGGISTDITDFKLAEETLEEISQFDQLLTRLSMSFIDLPVESMDAAITGSLLQIGRFFRLDRCSLGHMTPDGKQMNVTHVWNRKTPSGARLSYAIDDYPWLLSPFKTGEPLIWTRSEGLPVGSEADIDLLEKSNMQCFAGIPVKVAGKLSSCLGFSDTTSSRKWDDRIVNRFPLIASIFGQMIARKQAEDKLQKASAELEERLSFEQTIADIAARMAQVQPDDLNAAIDEVLENIGHLLHTERAFLAQFKEEDNRLVFTNTWAAEGFNTLSEVFKLEKFSSILWLARMIRDGRVVTAGPGLNGLPEEARELRRQLESDGISSVCVVPVIVEDRSIGMLAVDTIDQPRQYPSTIVDRLRFVADIIGSTVQRIRAQQLLIEQLQFEDLISNLSATFINVKASEIDKNIERALQLVVQHLDIDRGNLFEFSRGHEKLTLTHSSARKGLKNSPRALYSAQHPWFTQMLIKGEMFCFSQPSELPNEAQAERKYLLNQGIQSAMVFPLKAAGVIQGGITLSSISKRRQWSEHLMQQCKILTQVFSNALLRKVADKKIGDTLVKIRELNARIQKENIYLREEIELHHRHEEIIGRSDPVVEMLSRAEQVAPTDATVLILGETGTGKELIANAIHRLSRRKDHTIIKVNCAALPSTLIESELFGREKGAYTGAMSRQVGRFEIADGSTLFLDEIGELPLELQAKLLRVLQDGRFERLGNPATISVDVRIIASTNRDLAMLVSDGTFREDLFYRLNVFPIIVPPLRDRLEDIPLLVWHFVRELESSMGKNIEKISQKSINLLEEYEWPGNIRELKNLVENAIILSKGKRLSIYPPVKSPSIRPNIIKLEDVTRNHIKDVLRKTTWRVRGPRGAAEQLGLKPTTLEAKMKKLGISRPQ